MTIGILSVKIIICRILYEKSATLLKESDFMDKKLGVTQDYDRSNYDSERAKKAYKEKTFGDHAVIIDQIGRAHV